MSYRFTLQLTQVKCIESATAMGEWGKTEMRLFGFGISRRGHKFATGFRNLGSYDQGDVAPASVVPQTWFDHELEDDGLEVLLYLWLVEEDSGGVGKSAHALEAKFYELYGRYKEELEAARFPRECTPFIAFYKSVIYLELSMKNAARDGANNDEVCRPFDHLIHYDGPGSLSYGGELHLVTPLLLSTEDGFASGRYDLTLAFHYHRDPILAESPGRGGGPA
jgi:hypothetical protein